MPEHWQERLQADLMTAGEICRYAGIDRKTYDRIQKRFPIRLVRGMLAHDLSGAIARQYLPQAAELESGGLTDPLQEERHRKAGFIIHRYPNRALFLVSSACPSYCRFCTRRRLIGKSPGPNQAELLEALEYIRNTPQLNEVILSGGDPLLLSDEKLDSILSRLRSIPHLRLLRIATRAFLPIPERFTPGLITLLRKYQPVYLITQFNHPDEFSPGVDEAVQKVADAGIPILNQSVLLRGINDNPQIMLELVQKMVERRIRPYYLHQLDPVRGALHFQVPVKRGKQIMEFLRQNIGGYAVPAYVFDDPAEPAKKLLYP